MSSEKRKRNCKVSVRVTERTRRDIEYYAHESWQSMSKWITEAIEAKVERSRMEDCN